MLAFTGLIENLPESTGMDLLIPFRLVLQDERMGRDRAERNGTGLNGMGWDSCKLFNLSFKHFTNTGDTRTKLLET